MKRNPILVDAILFCLGLHQLHSHRLMTVQVSGSADADGRHGNVSVEIRPNDVATTLVMAKHPVVGLGLHDDQRAGTAWYTCMLLGRSIIGVFGQPKVIRSHGAILRDYDIRCGWFWHHTVNACCGVEGVITRRSIGIYQASVVIFPLSYSAGYGRSIA